MTMGLQADITESFGQFLKRERELREIPLEEVAAYTRIKIRALEAIEHDDFAALPPLAFVRAFIRCYADYIGLNVPDVMLRFDAFIQNRYPELTGEVPIIRKSPRPRQRYVPLIMGIAVILIVAFAYWRSRSPSKPETREQKPPPPETHLEADRGSLPPTAEVLTAKPTERKPEEGAGEINRGREQDTDQTPGSTPGASEAEERGPFSAERAPKEAPKRPADAVEAPTESSDSPTREPKKLSTPWTSTYDNPLGPPLELAAFQDNDRDSEEEVTMEFQDLPRQIAHRVTITVDESCWIQFFIDQDEPRQAILQPDQTVTFEAISSVRIKIGHPDGVGSVIHNGQNFDFQPQCAPWWLNFPSHPDDNICP